MSTSEINFEVLRADMVTAVDSATPRPDCPEPNDLWLARRAELSSDQTQEIIDHVGNCIICSQSWLLAKDLDEIASRSRKSKSGRLDSPALKLLAAMVCIAILLPLLMVSEDQTTRTAQHIEMHTTSVNDVLSRQSFELSWSGPKGVERYEIQLSWDSNGHSKRIGVFETVPDPDLSRVRYQVPEEAFSQVPTGTEIFGDLIGLRSDEIVAKKSFKVLIE